MAIQWKERPGSREITSGESASRLDRFALIGTADHAIAYMLAAQFSAPIADGAGQVLYRQELKLAHQGADLWYVDVPYGRRKQENGQWTFAGSVQGGTVRIRSAKTETAFGAFAPDMGKLIDVQKGEVKGTDIIIPSVKFSYDFKHPAGVVNEAFCIALADYVACTNSDPWHGMPAGSALYLGFTCQGGSDQETTIRHEVAYSKNLVDATIAGIAGVNKKGWEVAWEFVEQVANAGKPAVACNYVYVNRVYDECPFADVLGF